MRHRYYDLNTYFRKEFGERVHKIAIDAGLSCPNRDNTVGTGGCIYCNARGSGTGAYLKGLSITEQLENAKVHIIRRFKAKRFMAYFQSYSNTYAAVDRLKAMFDEALSVPDVIGMAVGTRPDCVDTAKLDLLESYARDHLVWIEYGLQSAHDDTLFRIRRGHTVEQFEKSVRATADRGMRICAHIILGLPGETADHMKATADFIARLPIDGIKLHLLYVIKDTPMEALYRSGDYRCLGQQEYVERVCDVLERLPEQMVIQRLTGDPHPRELVAPEWALDKKSTLNRIMEKLEEKHTWQGKKLRSK
jgi:radical SAM protein (TIGR01212 family)